ncbi:MAG TPA: FAD-dependent monooxygenase [Xanthobacteraceae bacterium]
MTQEHVPVLIVGAGGAGLTMSLLLQQQGIASTLIERRSDISWVPRARNLNFRTLEVFRGLRLEEEVRSAGMHVSNVFRKPSLASSEQQELVDTATLQPPGLEQISPEPFYLYCPQNRLEPLLRAAARKRGCDVRYGTKLASFAQEGNGITARLEESATAGSTVLRADYLVAADGAHSHIREALGIKSQGHGELPDYFIFVYFRAPWQKLIAGHEADAILVRNSDVDGTFLAAKDDLGMFMITYRPAQGETVAEFTHERCQKLVEKAIGQPGMAIEIIDVVHFQTAESVAEQFQMGHAFLVGDAAHTMPGYKGLGLNTAVQSAANLAWKLAAVIRGQAAPGLLATYQAERHPVGRFAARQSLTGPGVAEVVREGVLSKLLPEKEDLPLFYPIIGYRYRSQAILSENAAEAEPGEIALLDREELDGQPGTRVPHLWLGRQGQRISTLDLLDGRFVLLAGPEGAPWCAAAPAAAASLGIEPATYRIGSNGDLLDLENAAAARMGLSTEGAVLLRPDGFVAWRADTLPPSPESKLVQVLSSILGR